MECKVTSESIVKSITKSIEDQLVKSKLFKKQGSIFVSMSNIADSQPFMEGINNMYSAPVLRRTGNMYSIVIPEEVVKDYMLSTNDAKEANDTLEINGNARLEENSWNNQEMFMYLNFPEITDMTNDNLKSFLRSLNPSFRTEEVDNLSVNGISYVKEFLIQVRTLSKLSAMPEEVAHMFIELLPNDSDLKKSLIENVTSYPIYSLTLQQYKNTYITSSGSPDYNKIKREAAAKLVAEYIYALSTNDNSRLEVLAKPKQNFLQRWFNQFLRWLGLGMLEHTNLYADVGGLILSGENDQTLKDEREVADISFTDSYFFKLSEQELFENAYEILRKKPDRLQEIVSNFSKQFGRAFTAILRDDQFIPLNEELKRTEEGVGTLNRLTEIKIALTDVGIDLKAATDSDAFLIGIKQFLEAVDRLDILSEAILKVIRNKEKSKSFDSAINNIKELEGYFSIYESFKNIISSDLAAELIRSDAAPEVVQSILKTQTNFDIVNEYILNKHRDNLFIFYKSILSDTNKGVDLTLKSDIDKQLAKDNPNKDILAYLNERKKLIVSDDEMIAILSGRGKDIDRVSGLNHLVNAAVLNGDLYVSGIASYIQKNIEKAQQKAKVDQFQLMDDIDPIQKELRETADVTGRSVTFADTIYDRQLEDVRSVLTWLNPHKNIQPVLEKHKKDVREAREAYYNVDKADIEERNKAFEKLRKVQKDYNEFLQKYYNRPFIKEYYTFRMKYEENPIFVQAMAEYKGYSDQIKATEALISVEYDNTELQEKIAILRRTRANLLNEYDTYGDLKAPLIRDANGNLIPDPSSVELQKVRILRQYFDESKKYKEIDNTQTERSYLIGRSRQEQRVDFAIQEIRNNYRPTTVEEVEIRLREILKDNRIRIVNLYELGSDENVKGIDYAFIKDILMKKWELKNITIQKNEKYYEDEKRIIEELNELSNKGELTEVEKDLKRAYEEVRNILFGSRDEIGQINPDSLNDEEKQLIIRLEMLIEDLKPQRPSRTLDLSEMTPKDRIAYEQYDEIINNPNSSAGDRRAAVFRKGSLEKIYKEKGKNKTINDLYQLLGGMSEKVPTQYYWDKMSAFIPAMSEFIQHIISLGPDPDIEKQARELDKQFAALIDNQEYDSLDFDFFTKASFEEFLDYIEEKKPNLYKWFLENHKKRKVFDPVNGKYVVLPYVRGSLYIYRSPVSKEHHKTVYNKKYQEFRVKNEFRTGYNPSTDKVELKVGVHVSNREDNNGFPEFLPLLPEQGAPANSPYINEAYYKLRDSKDPRDQARFKYLELLKNADLKAQEKVPPHLRRWMQVPVLGLSSIENIKRIPSAAKQQVENIKSFFKKNTAGEAEAQISGVDPIQNVDQFTQQVVRESIPKIGMSEKLPIESVSTDVLKSTLQFILKSYEFEGRSESHPVVKALVRVMKDNVYRNSNNKERTKIFEKIYSQMILQEIPESTLNNKQMRRVARFLTGNTSLRMMADIPGGMINYISATVNNVIEATAGRYISLQELGKGKILADRVSLNLFADFNKKSDLSLDTLLFNYFDFIQGEFEEDLLDRSSSLDKASSIRQLLMVPRKAGEINAQVSIAMGILEKTKVKNQVDGKTYPLHEIYKKEGKTNKLVLKEGFYELDEQGNKTYPYNPVDGEKFLNIKSMINHVNLQLHGNYAKLTQTEASRHSIGKLAENMKRWFMPALQRRMGRETPDVIFHDLTEGYYRTSAKAFYKVFTNLIHLDFGGAKDWLSFFWNTPRYRENLKRMGAELVQAALLLFTFAVVLGYSGDDKNKKLEENNWAHNMAILVLLRAYSETTAYIPIPALGFQELKRNVLTPFSLPADAVSNFAAILQLGVYQLFYWAGDPFGWEKELYYSKDSGYWYSEAGDSKLFKYMLRAIGYTGYTQQPEEYIKSFDNLQRRLK